MDVLFRYFLSGGRTPQGGKTGGADQSSLQLHSLRKKMRDVWAIAECGGNDRTCFVERGYVCGRAVAFL